MAGGQKGALGIFLLGFLLGVTVLMALAPGGGENSLVRTVWDWTPMGAVFNYWNAMGTLQSSIFVQLWDPELTTMIWERRSALATGCIGVTVMAVASWSGVPGMVCLQMGQQLLTSGQGHGGRTWGARDGTHGTSPRRLLTEALGRAMECSPKKLNLDRLLNIRDPDQGKVPLVFPDQSRCVTAHKQMHSGGAGWMSMPNQLPSSGQQYPSSIQHQQITPWGGNQQQQHPLSPVDIYRIIQATCEQHRNLAHSGPGQLMLVGAT
jgi:hypothetical protein